MNIATNPSGGTAAATTRRHFSDINVMVAGQGGDGSLTIASLLSALFAERGFHLYSTSNIASRIQGGHAAAFLRPPVTPSGCLGGTRHPPIALADIRQYIARAVYRRLIYN